MEPQDMRAEGQKLTFALKTTNNYAEFCHCLKFNILESNQRFKFIFAGNNIA